MSDPPGSSAASARGELADPPSRPRGAALSLAEWEAICERCGRCCYEKIEGEDGGVVFTEVPCEHLAADRTCRIYASRFQRVRDCLQLTPEGVRSGRLVPPTCAYLRWLESGDGRRPPPELAGHPMARPRPRARRLPRTGKQKK